MFALRIGLAAAALAAGVTTAFAFEISSPSIADGKWDKKFVADKVAGCDGGNVSPALTWKDAPEGTKSFALTMFDPDAPTGSGWWHWQVWNIPASATGLPEGAGSQGAKTLPKGAVQGKGDIGRAGYLGPCPPDSGVHHYTLTLYALKAATVKIDRSASPAMTVYEVMGQSLGKATVVYTFQK